MDITVVTEVEDNKEMVDTQKTMNGNLEARLEALKADLDALQKDMRGLFRDVKDVAGHGVAEAVHSASTAASDAIENAQEWTDDGAASVRAAVRKQPLAACALSMSAGALLGALFLRR